MIARPTVTDIITYREVHECGVHEAKRECWARWRRDTLYALSLRASELYTVEACHEVIKDLVDFLHEAETQRGA